MVGHIVANLQRRYDNAMLFGDWNLARECAVELRRYGVEIVPGTDGGAATYQTATAPVVKRGPGRPRKNPEGKSK